MKFFFLFFFLRRWGWTKGVGVFKKGVFTFAWDFNKEKNIYNAFQLFWIPKISFEKYKISTPISLPDAKTQYI